MHRMEFEPTIPVFELARIAHALDRATIVISSVIGEQNMKPAELNRPPI
jgi:hypothetical protein